MARRNEDKGHKERVLAIFFGFVAFLPARGLQNGLGFEYFLLISTFFFFLYVFIYSPVLETFFYRSPVHILGIVLAQNKHIDEKKITVHS